MRFNIDESCIINTTTSIDIQGKISSSTGPAVFPPVPQPFEATIPGLLVLASPSISLDALSSIAVSVVELVGVSVAASGSVSAGYKASNCSVPIPYMGAESACEMLPFSYRHGNWTPWASVVVDSGNATFGANAQMTGAVVVMCVEEVLTLGTMAKVSTTSDGCSESEGQGAGSLVGTGEGGGAGHGGEGGPQGNGSRALSFRATKAKVAGGSGQTYDDGPIPSMVGSGGSGGSAGGTGGSGGGLIYIETRLLTAADARLSSDGGGGTENAASGGGSGGTIILRLAALHAEGKDAFRISAAGGAGSFNPSTNKSGGGGGGGRLYIEWSQAQSINQRVNVVFSTEAGAVSLPSSAGHEGTIAAKPECGPGSEGVVLCVSCPVGTFKNETGLMACRPCEDGSFTNSTHSTSCTHCSAGTQPNVNRTGCDECPINKISTEVSPRCEVCAAGSESNVHHTFCDQCEMGTFKQFANDTECIACDEGTYSNVNFTGCDLCDSLPTHAHYVDSKCQYDCEVGYLLPDCLTPFWSMVESMGGVAVFVGFLVLSITATFIPFLCCFIRSKRRQREKEILEQDEAETDSEAGDSRPPSPSAQGKLTRNFSAAPPSYAEHSLNTSLMEHTTKLTFTKDLPSTSLQPVIIPIISIAFTSQETMDLPILSRCHSGSLWRSVHSSSTICTGHSQKKSLPWVNGVDGSVGCTHYSHSSVRRWRPRTSAGRGDRRCRWCGSSSSTTTMGC